MFLEHLVCFVQAGSPCRSSKCFCSQLALPVKMHTGPCDVLHWLASKPVIHSKLGLLALKCVLKGMPEVCQQGIIMQAFDLPQG